MGRRIGMTLLAAALVSPFAGCQTTRGARSTPPLTDPSEEWARRSAEVSQPDLDPQPAPAPEVRTTAWMDGVSLPEGAEHLGSGERVALQAALDGIRSADFAVYARSARAVIEMGDAAAPYLGHMLDGGGPKGNRERTEVVLRSLCGTLDIAGLGAVLASEYPSVRTAGAQACGKRREAEHAPKLVELLDDDVVSVRRAAVGALRRIANSFFGYRADESLERRAGAVARWRELWGAPRAG